MNPAGPYGLVPDIECNSIEGERAIKPSKTEQEHDHGLKQDHGNPSNVK